MTMLAQLAAEVEAKPRRKIDFVSYTEPTEGEWRSRPLLFWGGLTLFDAREQMRLLDARRWPYTAAELGRHYVRTQLRRYRPAKGSMGHRRVTFRQGDAVLLRRSPPTWFSSARVGEMVLVDVAACYWSLLSAATLDLDYRPGRYALMAGRVPFDDDGSLGANKAVRNTIPGTIRRTTSVVSRYSRKDATHGQNPFLAPCLWGYLMDVCHHIAADAIASFDAFYWDTDGGIFPPERVDDFLGYLASVWKLDGHVEASGRGRIFGLRNYEIGDVEKGKGCRVVGGNRALNVRELSASERATVRRAREACFASSGVG